MDNFDLRESLRSLLWVVLASPSRPIYRVMAYMVMVLIVIA